MQQPIIIITKDGSHSLYNSELNEHYHSVHGAIQESLHVFIEAGLKYLTKQKEIKILEVGFGTGLNVLLSLIESSKQNTKINYTTIEAFPLDSNIVANLNYIKQHDAYLFEEKFNLIHSCKWNNEIKISNNFVFTKLNSKMQNVVLNEHYDLIYFDAFAPSSQPEMWTKDIFKKIFNATNTNGILVTYCAKGEVKRTLKNVGYTVESIKGPPGKREMIRAVKY